MFRWYEDENFLIVYCCSEHLPTEKLTELASLPKQSKEQPLPPTNNQIKKCSYCQNTVSTGNTFSCGPCGTIHCSKNCCETSTPYCKNQLEYQKNSPSTNN